MTYLRVIPRDLFNESKLLKSLGQLCLLIHERLGIRWPLRMELDREEEGFVVFQCQNSGNLCCLNLEIVVGGRQVLLASTYNSKKPYPLVFLRDDESEGDVLTDDGAISQEFAAWLDDQVSLESRHGQ